MSTPPRLGLFLDLDGTLADSMPVMRLIYDRFLEELGSEGSEEEFAALAGRPLRDIADHLKQAHGLKVSPQEILATYLQKVESVYAREAQPMPGARQLLAAAAERGVYAAVVTSAPRQMAQEFLRHHGLAAFIQAVVGSEEVSCGKPDPEPYRRALGLAGLKPAQGLAAEDSVIGAASALGAGLATFIMRPQGGRLPGLAGEAGYIKSLEELIPRLEPGAPGGA